MPRKSRKQPDLYTVEITPETYHHLCALSERSRMPIGILISMATRLLDASTRELHAMNAPPLREKPQPEQVRKTLIRQTVPVSGQPTRFAAILAGIAHTPRRRQP